MHKDDSEFPQYNAYYKYTRNCYTVFFCIRDHSYYNFSGETNQTNTSRCTTKKSVNIPDDQNRNSSDNDDKNDDSEQEYVATEPKPYADFSSLHCSFVFDTDASRPAVANQLNGNYDLCFIPNVLVLYKSDKTLVKNPSLALQDEMKFILNHQGTTTGREALNDPSNIFTSSCLLIINTIATSFTFLSDTSRAKGLIKSTQSLLLALSYTKKF